MNRHIKNTHGACPIINTVVKRRRPLNTSKRPQLFQIMKRQSPFVWKRFRSSECRLSDSLDQPLRLGKSPARGSTTGKEGERCCSYFRNPTDRILHTKRWASQMIQWPMPREEGKKLSSKCLFECQKHRDRFHFTFLLPIRRFVPRFYFCITIRRRIISAARLRTEVVF